MYDRCDQREHKRNEKIVDAETKRERAGEAQKTRQRHLNAQPLCELSNWNGCRIVLGGGVFPSFSPPFVVDAVAVFASEKQQKTT